MKETTIKFQPETIAAIHKLDPKCVDMHSTKLGVDNGEPLLVAMDGLLRYAKAYEKRFEGKLCSDGVMGDYWLDALKGVHGLLNGDGAVALERGITTDSKSNGVIESIYWSAISAAGFKDETSVVPKFAPYQPKTGAKCSCRPGISRDNCATCEGTGWVIDFKAIRERNVPA